MLKCLGLADTVLVSFVVVVAVVVVVVVVVVVGVVVVVVVVGDFSLRVLDVF